MIPQAHLRESAHPLARTDKLVVQDLVDETLIYDLDNDKAYCLNQTSALVWQSCDGKISIDGIATKLENTLKEPVSADLVWLALEQLKKQDLVYFDEASFASFKQVGRRDMVRRVGMVSMIALPVVSSLIAPTAADAQTGGNSCISINGGGIEGPCMTPADCLSFSGRPCCCKESSVPNQFQCKPGQGNCT